MIVNTLTCKLLTWPLCLLFIAGIALGKRGGALCVGDNGHFKVESVCQSCCGNPDEACFLVEANPAHDHHDDCANCTDHLLIQHTLSYVPSTRTVDAGAIILSSFAILVPNIADQHSSIVNVQVKATCLFSSAGSLLSATILRC